MNICDELSSRARFGMKPGLDAMRTACAACNHPERAVRGVVHVAGTNGKGAVCAMLDACLRAGGFHVGRYTSPHLVSVNERFFLDGAPVALEVLEPLADAVFTRRESSVAEALSGLTYFEYLTLLAFTLYARQQPDYTILETGLGGRLDATNVCSPALTVITHIGLDHCDWLGNTIEEIAAEKAGIIKSGVPVVLGENAPSVRAVVEARAREVGASFYYAPDLVTDSDIPRAFSLAGTFNRENALTALAALRVLGVGDTSGLCRVVWPGRFQRAGDILIDGAHNPPAARALVRALRAEGVAEKSLVLVCGFCGDKDVDEVLRLLAPLVARAYAVRTNNPRSLSPEVLAARLRARGIPADPMPSLEAALNVSRPVFAQQPALLVAGSLFLAGEALVALGLVAASRFDSNERMKGKE